MWRKSSYSDTNGACVEVDFARSSYCDSSSCVEVGFRKSSRSAGNGNCVEVCTCAGEVLVRDSKDPTGPVLSFASAAWREFLAGVSAGEFDL